MILEKNTKENHYQITINRLNGDLRTTITSNITKKDVEFISNASSKIEKQVNINHLNGDFHLHLDRPYKALSNFSSDKINQQFQQPSHELSNYQNYFEGLPNSALPSQFT